MASVEKYANLISSVVDYVGGKENVEFFTHCVTRLRFNVKDQSLVNAEEIGNLAGVLGCQWQNGQFQIIVGQAVGDVYTAICKKYGFSAEKEVSEDTEKENEKLTVGSVFSKILDGISGSLAPAIPALIGCGMIQVILILAGYAGIDSTSGFYQLLNFAGQAGFFFLPVIVGSNAAKKFGANPGLGMVIGGMLMYYSCTGGALPTEFLGIPVYAASYTSTIFPVILCVAVMAPIEKFFAKHSPEVLRSILEPLCTLLVMIPLAFCLLGPVGSFLGQYVSAAVIWVYNTLGFVGVALLAAIMPFLIMTGMHGSFVPYLLQMFAEYGYEPIFFTALVLSNINQGVASLAVALKTKNTNLRSTGLSCAITGIVGGVTEPAMYGVSLKYKTPMYGAMIGSAVAGAFAGLMKVYIYAFAGASSVVALPCFIGPSASNVVFMAISMVIGAVVTFVATWVLYKD